MPDAAFEAAGITPRGELWAAMLDTKAGWDELIRRHAPDAKVRDAVLANPLYQNITSRFVHSHDYLAMEQLHDLHASGEYDLVVVDTPPSRNALSVLDAPARMLEFFGSRLLRWLTVPYRSRLFTVASKPFYQIADRVLGQRVPARHRRLLRALPGDGEGLRRAGQGGRGAARRPPHDVPRRLDAGDGTGARGAVPRPRAARPRLRPRRDRRQPRAAERARRAAARRRRPKRLADGRGRRAARRRDVAAALDAPGRRSTSAVVRDVLAEVAARFHDVALVAAREAERRAELAALAPQVLDVPSLDSDVNDLGGLMTLVDHLRS